MASGAVKCLSHRQAFCRWMASMVLLGLLTILDPSEGACSILSKRCDFPFEFEGEEHNTCVEHPESDDLVCRTAPTPSSDRWTLSPCDEGCFKEGAPMNFSDPSFSPVSSFCKSKPVACMFPFAFEGVTYDACTDAGADVPWCATSVDGDGVMVEHFWGQCDMEAQDGCAALTDPLLEPMEPEPEQPQPMGAETQFQYEDVVADLALEQVDPDSPVTIKGQITGISPPGSHAFTVYEGTLDDTSNCSTIFEGTNSTRLSSFGAFSSDSEGVAQVDLGSSDVSLYGEEGILNKILLVYTREGENEALVGCGPIMEPSLDLTLIIIIVLVVVIVLLLLLICCLCFYCCKRKRGKGKGKLPSDETDLPYANGSTKKPLYDELSIPFIDASPAATPKTGRSTEKLSFFHRSSSVARSRGSLSQESV